MAIGAYYLLPLFNVEFSLGTYEPVLAVVLIASGGYLTFTSISVRET